MRILLAPDKFKGSLTAPEAAAALAAGLRKTLADAEFDLCPIADGGEGTIDAASVAGFSRRATPTTDPRGTPILAEYALRAPKAVVELACASGLQLLPDGQYVPMTASSYGTGQLIAAALDAGARSIVLGIGGSACTDGGAGMVTALGARLRDSQGRDLPWGGASLVDLDHLDLTGLHPALAGRQEPRAELVVACDVTNPLLGATGAARVYGPQKGATPQQVTQLEQALTRWADIVELTVDGHFRDRAGAGAAGGVGFAAMALLGAQVRPGVEVILELLDFPSRLSAADLVITGEGSLDRQTLFGKGPAGVAAAAASLGIPVVAVAGSVRVSPSALSDAGFTRAYALTDLEPDLDICLTQAKSLVERTAQRVASDIAACGIRTAEGSVDT